MQQAQRMSDRTRWIPMALALGGLALPSLLSPALAAGVVPNGTARTEVAFGDEEPTELSMTKLMAAKYEPGQPLDSDIKDLDGKKVTIKGLMAIGTLEGQETFELTSDSCGCGQSKVNHFVKVTLVDETTKYTPNEITVTGTFEASEEIVDGFVVSVYRIVADSIDEDEAEGGARSVATR